MPDPGPAYPRGAAQASRRAAAGPHPDLPARETRVRAGRGQAYPPMEKVVARGGGGKRASMLPAAREGAAGQEKKVDPWVLTSGAAGFVRGWAETEWSPSPGSRLAA